MPDDYIIEVFLFVHYISTNMYSDQSTIDIHYYFDYDNIDKMYHYIYRIYQFITCFLFHLFHHPNNNHLQPMMFHVDLIHICLYHIILYHIYIYIYIYKYNVPALTML